MMLKLLILFIAVPVAELYLLFQLKDWTSWGFTLALIIVTGIAGSTLARIQGFRTFEKINRSLAKGQLPTESLIDALMIFVAGAVLLTPGVLTDIFGLTLLLPPCRRFYGRIVGNYFKSKIQMQGFSPYVDTQWSDDTNNGGPRSDSSPPQTRGPSQTRVIDSYVIEDKGNDQG